MGRGWLVKGSKRPVLKIKKVARKYPLLGAEGAIKFMEKLWPALQHVDSSSGALGTAVYNAMGVLVDIVIEAPADDKTRSKWLDRLWEAFNDDGVGFLDVQSAFHYAIKAAKKLGLEVQVRKDIKKMVAQDTSPSMFMKDVLGEHLK